MEILLLKDTPEEPKFKYKLHRDPSKKKFLLQYIESPDCNLLNNFFEWLLHGLNVFERIICSTFFYLILANDNRFQL